MSTQTHANVLIEEAKPVHDDLLRLFVMENHEGLNIDAVERIGYADRFISAASDSEDLVLLAWHILARTEDAQPVGTVVGIAIVTRGRSRSRHHAAQLRLYVAGGERDQGIGSALIERVLDWARSEGIVRIEATPYIDRDEHGLVTKATGQKIAFFNRHGFLSEGIMLSAAKRLPDTIVDTMMMAWIDTRRRR